MRGRSAIGAQHYRGGVTERARVVGIRSMDRAALLNRARTRGVNPFVYWIVRAILQPFFHVYFRMSAHRPRAHPGRTAR